MARPTKLTAEVHEQIISLIKLGNYRETAAAAAGIDRLTLRAWLRKGAAGNRTYAKFSKEMDKAEAEAESAHVLRIVSASIEDYRAATWILSRKYADKWGDKVQLIVQEQMTLALEKLKKNLEPELFARVMAILASED